VAGSQISKLQKQIKAAEGAHVSAPQLAALWVALADANRGVVDLEAAENAFAHAIRLLHGTNSQGLYANALDGIATVYFATGRADKAERCLRQAIEIQHTAGDLTAETITRRNLAAALIKEQKYAEAEKQASEVLHLLEAQTHPNIGELIVVYLIRSRATCGMRQCEEALQDIDRAEALAVNNIGTDPIDVITIPALRGIEQFRSGAVDQGDRSIQQALRLLDSRVDIPVPFQRHLREALLEEYSQLLGCAHRKRAKKKVDEEIARIKAEQTGCNRCTVSAASLGLLP
jgi:tetratricopeptide (TPR) repeat protein